MNVVARDLNEDGRPDLAIPTQSAPLSEDPDGDRARHVRPVVEYRAPVASTWPSGT
jgi:hypothetical protein